jgi:predicted porin
LSKRTNLYAIYGSSQQSSSATIPSEGANQYAVGLRHTF